MGFLSTQEEIDNLSKRPPLGWGTYTVTMVRGFTTKAGDADIIKIGLRHEDGSELEWLIKSTDKSGAKKTFLKLCQYESINWPRTASIEAIAQLLSDNLTSIDALIGYAKGDGCFVNDVAPDGTPHPVKEESAEPPAQKVVRAPIKL